MCRCCQKDAADAEYHASCLKKLFSVDWPPAIPYAINDLPAAVGKDGGRMSISGVQIKASCRVIKISKRIAIVGDGGMHILKPQPSEYPELPQCENLCMNIAADLKLRVPPHGLFAMKDGTPCYVIRRFDRSKKELRLQVEDMAQILERATEQKYDGSMEQVGKAIWKHTTSPGVEVLDFFERVLLCFLIGNGDMHLKNWSLIREDGGVVRLAPCYDFVSSHMYMPTEEDSALTINGRKSKLQRGDFEALASRLGVDSKAAKNVFEKYIGAKSIILDMAETSELSARRKAAFKELVEARFLRIT